MFPSFFFPIALNVEHAGLKAGLGFAAFRETHVTLGVY